MNRDRVKALDTIGRPIVVATHPRSGTHLTIDLLRKQFDACKGWLWFGETLHHLYLNLDRLDRTTTPRLTIPKAKDLLSRPDRPIIKTHSLPALPNFEGDKDTFAATLVDKADVVYVVRDGRDVMCSAHVWKQEYDPSARCSLSAFLRQRVRGQSRVKAWAKHVRAWTSLDDAYVIRFEDILASPRTVVDQLASWLDLEPLGVEPYLPTKVKRRGRWADYWRRLTRDFESTAIPGRYNGKEPEDWQTAFSADDRAYFDQEAGEALREMGYESDEEWVQTGS